MLSRSELEHRERVAKVKSLDAALAAFNRSSATHALEAVTHSSNGIGQMLFVPQSAPAEKVEASSPANFHPKVKPLVGSLSADAASLLNLVIKADEVYRGAQLLDLSSFSVKSALQISEGEAIEARSELERRGLIVFHDNGSGYRGFYPRLP
ncbi:hypothetical protein [Sinorhizobium americanum]|uniref:hypothetical protein n=1 Tax=Sinorhizobium americanum TaxID=194963 RepID=UPI0012EB1D7F|nr:hypothetical protein [Sinorhizobium americanum]